MSNPHGNPGHGPGPLWHLPDGPRRLLLIAAPLALAGLTVLHPNPDHNTRALMDASTWFMAYHLLQLPLLGLVAISVFLLADDLRRASAWPVCLGMGTFLLFFSAYDTLAGVGTGLAMHSSRELPASQQQAVFDIVEDWPGLEPSVIWLSLLGTLGWVLAVGYLTVTTRAAGAPRTQWLFLALAAFFLMLGHPFPFGTIAFGSLAIAALAHERQALRDKRPETTPTDIPAGPGEAETPVDRVADHTSAGGRRRPG